MDDDQMEKSAAAQNELVNAAQNLVEEFGYSKEDIERIIDGAIE